jgi:hypothetical protein
LAPGSASGSRQDVLGNGVEQVAIDDVARERLPGDHAVDVLRRERVVDLDAAGQELEKSPLRIFSVGTECVTASTVSSCSFS